MTDEVSPQAPESAARPRVAVSRSDLPGAATRALAEVAEVVEWPGAEPPTAEELRAFVAGCSGLLALGTDRIDAALLDAAGPSLQVVALASMGFDAADVAAAGERGVVTTHTPTVLAETTADLAFALILWARRRLRVAERTLLDGGWTTFRMGDLLGLDVHGARLGLLGYGQIGQAVARRARGFGMVVRHHDPLRPDGDGLSEPVGFDELVATSDVLSLHVPLTPATRGLVGAEVLARMQSTATLVNTSRGGVVDEDALLAALRAGTLHSAGLDVMEREPRSDPADPLLADGRLVVLPHVGSATEATRAAMVDLAARNITAVLTGSPAPTPIPRTAARPGERWVAS
jgi:glyoxylate reductase